MNNFFSEPNFTLSLPFLVAAIWGIVMLYISISERIDKRKERNRIKRIIERKPQAQEANDGKA